MQLAAFRVLRQQQKHTADLTARLAQAEQDAAQQRLERDREAQASRVLLDAAQRQIDVLDEALRATRALVVAQSAKIGQGAAGPRC